MANKQGTNQIVDAFIGDKLIEARYVGQTKYFDAYTEVTGALPLSFNSRVAGALKNYRIYGDSDGAGVPTENLVSDYLVGYNIDSNGEITESSNLSLALFEVTQGETYTAISSQVILGFFTSKPVNNSVTYNNDRTVRTNEPYTFTAPITGWCAVRYSTNDATPAFAGEGSTAPTSYIPPGYKIPILNTSGVTENLFDKDATDTNNGYVDNSYLKSDGTVNTSDELAISEYIKVDELVSYSFTNIGLYGSLAICFYDVEKSYISGQSYNSRLQVIVSTPENAVYARLSFKKSVSSQIMFVEGNIIPDHYIPHRYTSNYDLMIGSTKLGAEEYVDYGEQKVYKRTENLFDKDAKDTDNGYINDTFLYSSGATKSNEAYYVSEYIQINPNTVYFLKDLITTATSASLCFYDNEKQFISGAALLGLSNIVSPGNARYLKASILKTNEDIAEITSLQPTDPPAPFPAISAYKGENTLSSTETVGEVTVKGRIAPMYRQVEYLKSTGTQVIATDIMPKNTYKYETKIKIGSGSGGSNGCRMPFGVYETSNNVATGTTCLTISNPYSDRNVYYRLGTDSSTTYHFGSTLDNTAIEYTLARPNCKFNATDIAVSYPINLSEPTVPLAVFGVNRKADNNVDLWPYNFTSDCVIYYFKIYDSNSNLIYDLIPVERYDGVLGLYDKITAKFYTNTGTGEFVKGDYVDQTT